MWLVQVKRGFDEENAKKEGEGEDEGDGEDAKKTARGKWNNIAKKLQDDHSITKSAFQCSKRYSRILHQYRNSPCNVNKEPTCNVNKEPTAAELESFLTKKMKDGSKKKKDKKASKETARKRKHERFLNGGEGTSKKKTRVSSAASDLQSAAVSKEHHLVDLVQADPLAICEKVLSGADAISKIQAELLKIRDQETELEKKMVVIQEQKLDLEKRKEELSKYLVTHLKSSSLG